ncbi:Intersectin-2 EH domain and SH3 domain regulator of endocytosis 2 [Balamuthia mandrillaris]
MSWQSWNKSQTAKWLEQIVGLPQYCSLFLDGEVDGEVIALIRHEDLQSLGITSFKHRILILNAIKDLQEGKEVVLPSGPSQGAALKTSASPSIAAPTAAQPQRGVRFGSSSTPAIEPARRQADVSTPPRSLSSSTTIATPPSAGVGATSSSTSISAFSGRTGSSSDGPSSKVGNFPRTKSQPSMKNWSVGRSTNEEPKPQQLNRNPSPQPGATASSFNNSSARAQLPNTSPATSQPQDRKKLGKAGVGTLARKFSGSGSDIERPASPTAGLQRSSHQLPPASPPGMHRVAAVSSSAAPPPLPSRETNEWSSAAPGYGGFGGGGSFHRASEEEERKRREQEARLQREQEERTRREEEQRRRAEEDRMRLDEQRRRREEEERRRRDEEERKKREEELRRKREEEERRKREEEERKRKEAEERKRREEDERKRREEEDRRRLEDMRRQREEAERKQEEERKRREMEEIQRRRREEDERRQREEEARKRREEEEQKRINEERERLNRLSTPINTTPASSWQTAYNSNAGGAQNSSCLAIALYSFAGQRDEDLTFAKGDTITILAQDGNWWYGSLGMKEGYFPSNYVTIQEPVLPPPPDIMELPPYPDEVSHVQDSSPWGTGAPSDGYGYAHTSYQDYSSTAYAPPLQTSAAASLPPAKPQPPPPSYPSRRGPCSTTAIGGSDLASPRGATFSASPSVAFQQPVRPSSSSFTQATPASLSTSQGAVGRGRGRGGAIDINALRRQNSAPGNMASPPAPPAAGGGRGSWY